MLLNKYDPDDDLMCGAKAALGAAGEPALKQVATGFHLQQQQQQQQLVLGSRGAVGSSGN